MEPKPLLGHSGQILQAQAKEIISRLITFMKDEAENGITIPLHKYRERVLTATGISLSSYSRIQKMATDVETGASNSFSQGGQRKKKSRVVDSFRPEELEKLRNIIHDFHIIEKRLPTLKCILQKMKDCGFEYRGGISSLRKILIKMGFIWKKSEDNRSVLLESYDIRNKRITYLKTLLHYRQEGRPIIYCDESYLHSSHTHSKIWTDGKGKFRTPMNKGKRLIMLHAGGKDGFVPDGLLMFTSGRKTGDYHDEMNWNNFSQWARRQLIPNLPPGAVLVIDNASYHNVKSEKSITTATKKADLISWLIQRGITHDVKMTKPELYSLVKTHRPPPTFLLDSLLEENGHKVLRLPPYHPELNPIEKIWATVKNWVGQYNVTFKLQDVEKLARQKFENITPEEWANLVDNAAKYEDAYIQKEHLMDEYTDSLIFNVNTGSSDEWETDLSDIENDEN